MIIRFAPNKLLRLWYWWLGMAFFFLSFFFFFCFWRTKGTFLHFHSIYISSKSLDSLLAKRNSFYYPGLASADIGTTWRWGWGWGISPWVIRAYLLGSVCSLCGPGGEHVMRLWLQWAYKPPSPHPHCTPGAASNFTMHIWFLWLQVWSPIWMHMSLGGAQSYDSRNESVFSNAWPAEHRLFFL